MKNGIKLKHLVLLVAGVAVAVVLFNWPRGDERGEKRPERSGEFGKLRRGGSGKARPLSARQAVREAMDSLPRDRKRARPRRESLKFDLLDGITGRERNEVEELQRALDGDDTAGVMELASRAAESENPEVRMQALEALSWIGSDALPEMTALMADKDEEIAESARYHWEMALEQEDDPRSRFTIAGAALSAMDDKNSLASVGAMLANAATEIVDGEDDERQAALLRQDVVQFFVDIIEEDQNAARVEAAKEAYEDFSGESWEGIEAAEEYLMTEFDYESVELSEQADESADAEPLPAENVQVED